MLPIFLYLIQAVKAQTSARNCVVLWLKTTEHIATGARTHWGYPPHIYTF